MELRQLRYFREVVRLGNFRRAADRLNITQPALSKSIRALETELGVQLLERGVHGIAPTDYGAILLDCADSVSMNIDRASEEILSLSGRGGGTVRVGGMTTLMRWLVPAAVKRMTQVDPAAQIVTSIALLDDIVAQLEKGEIDLGLCTLLPGIASEDLGSERLMVDHVCVVADAGHPLVGRNDLTLADLAAYRWVLPGESDGWRKRLFALFRDAGLQRPDVAVQTGSAALMARLVEGTHHLSYLPSKLMPADDIFARLRPLAVQPAWPDYEVFLAYRRSAIPLPSTLAFIRAVKETASHASHAAFPADAAGICR
jgi:DNA-binding transcriptional LysR family regulator